jgi:hypothetical protein
MPYEEYSKGSARELRLRKRTIENLTKDAVAREIGVKPKKGLNLKMGGVLDLNKGTVETATTRNFYRSDAELKRQAKSKLKKKVAKTAAKTTARVAARATPVTAIAVTAAEAGYAVGALARKGYDAYQNKKTLKTLDKLAKESSKKTKKGSK